VPPHARARAFLEGVAKPRILVTYQELARSSDIATPFHPSGDGSPGTPDAGGRGVGTARSSLRSPSARRVAACRGPGFFDCARRLGRFAGDPDGQDARTFHAAELNAVFAFWDGSGDN
jgi:hypothetical protein